MFGMGWAELMIVGVVALIVVGPKDLPIMFRKIGEFVGKARGMARDFSRAMNDAADSTGMKDTMDSLNSIKDSVDSVASPTKAWTSYTPGGETGKMAEEKELRTKEMHERMAAKAEERLEAIRAENAAAKTAAAETAAVEPDETAEPAPPSDAPADEKKTDTA
ncbi:MAG: Sec-independent protein translocase protein TatB [Pseudomonadota bacterium]